MASNNFLALDLGASSGRAVLGTYDGKVLSLKEVHRFVNGGVKMGNTLYWDILHLYNQIQQSLIVATKMTTVESVGIDTWGVDFVLLDEEGRMLENPVHYRDLRTNQAVMSRVLAKVSAQGLYQVSGIQIMNINTLFQLDALRGQSPAFFGLAHTLLLIPDYLNFLLTGVKQAEETIASTTQLFNIKEREWNQQLMQAFNFNVHLFCPLVKPGTVLGSITQRVTEELNLLASPKVVAVAAHDTQSAQIAVPAEEENFIFLSCGTWSLLGCELDQPLINEKSLAYNLSNEAAYGDKVSFLKNICGLWILQELQAYYKATEGDISFAQLIDLATQAKPFTAFINVDDTLFATPGHMPAKIVDFCQKTHQPINQDKGTLVRVVLESLALRYATVIEEIADCTNQSYKKLYMVGGGCQNQLLCQLTANVCQIPVIAGPVEATVYGNLAVQLIASGKVAGLAEARQVIKNSTKPMVYKPQGVESSIFIQYKEILKKC